MKPLRDLQHRFDERAYRNLAFWRSAIRAWRNYLDRPSPAAHRSCARATDLAIYPDDPPPTHPRTHSTLIYFGPPRLP